MIGVRAQQFRLLEGSAGAIHKDGPRHSILIRQKSLNGLGRHVLHAEGMGIWLARGPMMEGSSRNTQQGCSNTQQ